MVEVVAIINDGCVLYVALATLPVVPGALCQPASRPHRFPASWPRAQLTSAAGGRVGAVAAHLS